MTSLQRPVWGDVDDGEGVAVADVIGARQGQLAVVAAGADDIPDAGGQAIRQHGLAARRRVRVCLVERRGQPCGACPDVEFVDDRVGGSQQQAVAAGVLVGLPGGEGGVGGGLFGADVDAAGIEVEADPGGVPAAQREGGGGFGAGVKPHHLREREGSGVGGDVAQHPAG